MTNDHTKGAGELRKAAERWKEGDYGLNGGLHRRDYTLLADYAAEQLVAGGEGTIPRPSTGHPACEYRCGICGGLVHFDDTPPNLNCQPGRGGK
jgi:hypothetical protein